MISTIGSQSSSSAERKPHGGRIVCRFTAVFSKSSSVPDTGKVQNPTICRVAGWMGEERLWLNQPINILFCDTHTHTHTHTHTYLFVLFGTLKMGNLGASLGAQLVKNPPATQETLV